RHRVAGEIVFLEAVGINPVVVHGGGKAVTRAVEAAGLTTTFLQGQRITDEATVKLVDDVLSREINPEIVAAIEALGGRARGCPGIAARSGRSKFADDASERERSAGPENERRNREGNDPESGQRRRRDPKRRGKSPVRRRPGGAFDPAGDFHRRRRRHGGGSV